MAVKFAIPLRSKAKEPRLARLKARRKLWLKVHRYLGLFAGAVLVVLGLTGSRVGGVGRALFPTNDPEAVLKLIRETLPVQTTRIGAWLVFLHQ